MTNVSANRNVFSCVLKAVWDAVVSIGCGMEFHTLNAEHENLRAQVLVRDASSVSRSRWNERNVLVGRYRSTFAARYVVDCLEVRDGTTSLF